MTTRVVYKYVIDLVDRQTLLLPAGAQILSVDSESPMLGADLKPVLSLWALVDPSASWWQHRIIRIVGTGHEITDSTLQHLATVLIAEGRLVYHVFEVRP